MGHVVEVCALLIGEEQVGFPQTLEHLGVDGEGVGLEVLRQLQPRVVPALPQEDVDSVVLKMITDRDTCINHIGRIEVKTLFS